MPYTSEARSVLDRARDQWDKTERIIKLGETVAGEAVTPAIFELRYAGRRLIDLVRASLDGDAVNNDELHAYLVEVEQFCLRAQHDAVDGIVGHLNARLRFMEREFGVALLFKHFPQYGETNVKLDQLAALIVESRGDRGGRRDIYDKMQDIELPDLIKKISELNRSENALIELAKQEQQDYEQKMTTLTTATETAKTASDTLKWTIAGVSVAAILSLAAIIIALLK